MKIWVAGAWYTLPNHILVVQLEDKDKKNIMNMHSDCDLYCEYDDKVFTTDGIVKLLTKLKKEIENESK